MADQTRTPAQSGRELARARRRAMSRTGAANLKTAGGASRESGKGAFGRANDSSAARQVVTSEVMGASAKPLTGRALSASRRAMLAKGGKRALKSMASFQGASAAPPPKAEERRTGACCDACAKGRPCTGGKEKSVATGDLNGRALDGLCEVIETLPKEANSVPQSVRELCRQRRSIIAKKGKQGTPSGAIEPVRGRRRARKNRAALEGLTGNAANVAASGCGTTVSSEVVDELCSLVERNPGAGTGVSSSVRELCRQRRSIIAKKGKQAVSASAKSGRPTRERRRLVKKAAEPSQRSVDSDASKSVNEQVPAVAPNVVDELCELVEKGPRNAVDVSANVRDFCRQRRKMLSQKGKLGLPGKAGSQARKSVLQNAAISSLTGSSLNGKELAKLYREARCQFGRGSAPSSRPTGRQRPRARVAPPKVEEGKTLSGQTVTGTQVEQTEKITGAEAGTCRMVTGTEYLGLEQYEKFCSGAPSPAAPKVSESETSHGQRVTGTHPVSSDKVTGSEAGRCKSVTGNEYLGVEHFESFCGTRELAVPTEKVVAGFSGKRLRITGVDEARENLVTGADYGTEVKVTGTEYTRAVPNVPVPAPPPKAPVTHTVAGTPVSGGDAPSKVVITGDDQGLCRRVTGTEYISTERFQTLCGTAPEGSVAKVGTDYSRGGLNITGNLVGRSEKVTGNEPGACRRVTGTQYADADRYGLCDQRYQKVQEMRTSRGKVLTGTEATPSPKSTGIVAQGRCVDVTGTEYVSQEQYEQFCPQVPSPPAKSRADEVSRTWNDQTVTGSQVGHSEKVTGDERGLCKTVTGTSYEGREEISQFCPSSSVKEIEERLRRQKRGMESVSGITPVVDERMAGNFQRGVCQSLTGTPYQGPEEKALCTASSMAGQSARKIHPVVRGPADQAPPDASVDSLGDGATTVPRRRGDFSIITPARAAWQQRKNNPVHASVYARRSSITGVVNKAEGVVSGTPEFRHLREVEVVSSSPEVEQEGVRRPRITGEGRENGVHITGDDWSRSSLVTGTEGSFSAKRNQTQQGSPVARRDIGAHTLKGRERPEKRESRVTGSSGGTSVATVTLSGGAIG